MAKKNEKANYRELTETELHTKLGEARDKLFQLRFQNATAPLKNPREIRETRRDVARLLTTLRQKGVRA